MFWHYSDMLVMDGTQVSVFKEAEEVSVCGCQR